MITTVLVVRGMKHARVCMSVQCLS